MNSWTQAQFPEYEWHLMEAGIARVLGETPYQGEELTPVPTARFSGRQVAVKKLKPGESVEMKVFYVWRDGKKCCP